MQLKIYRRSTIILSIVMAIDILAIVMLFKTSALWRENRLLVIFLFILGTMAIMMAYTWYDLNASKRLIMRKVRRGEVAMAKIIDGSFVRFGRDAKFKNHVYWKLNVDIIDNDMNWIRTTIIEKFATEQTKIHPGFVFVTYDEKHPENSLIIPNMIIASIPEYKPLVDDYEKAIHPTYLNVYYKVGLVVEDYKETMRKEKEYKKWAEEIDRQAEEKEKEREKENSK